VVGYTPQSPTRECPSCVTFRDVAYDVIDDGLEFEEGNEGKTTNKNYSQTLPTCQENNAVTSPSRYLGGCRRALAARGRARAPGAQHATTDRGPAWYPSGENVPRASHMGSRRHAILSRLWELVGSQPAGCCVVLSLPFCLRTCLARTQLPHGMAKLASHCIACHDHTMTTSLSTPSGLSRHSNKPIFIIMATRS
jgi:hypothetical protein